MRDEMGSFRVDVEIENPVRPGARRTLTSVLVDTGAELSWVPAPVLESLGIERYSKWRFRQADGTILERWAGPAFVHVAGKRTTDDVVFGEPGDLALLGSRTLEGLNFRVEPVTKQLVDAGPAPAAAVRERASFSRGAHEIAKAAFLAVAMLLASAASALAQQAAPDRKDWIQLFNGRDLQGWDVKITGRDLNDNAANTFRVEDGLLKVRYDGYDAFDSRFGHIFYREAFSHYIVAVEYRFVGDQASGGPGWAVRNSGIMVHSQSARSMGKDQDFPISIEVQLLGGTGSGERTTANLCTPGTHVFMDGKLFTPHCVNSRSKTFHGEQWVRVEVLVLGDSLVRHVVNGDTVMEYAKPQIGGGTVSQFDSSVKKDGTPLTEGYIALQSESHPIDFRKVEILNLVGCMDARASNYRSYYVRSDPSRCR